MRFAILTTRENDNPAQLRCIDTGHCARPPRAFRKQPRAHEFRGSFATVECASLIAPRPGFRQTLGPRRAPYFTNAHEAPMAGGPPCPGPLRPSCFWSWTRMPLGQNAEMPWIPYAPWPEYSNPSSSWRRTARSPQRPDVQVPQLAEASDPQTPVDKDPGIRAPQRPVPPCPNTLSPETLGPPQTVAP